MPIGFFNGTYPSKFKKLAIISVERSLPSDVLSILQGTTLEGNEISARDMGA